MLKGIIFDMDGTITLTEQLHHRAFSQIFKAYGIDFSYEEQLKRFAGSGSNAIFPRVFAEHGVSVSAEEIEKCITQKRELYTKIVQEAEVPFVEGVHEFVKMTEEKGLKRIIATGNGSLEAVHYLLAKINLDQYFPEIISVKDVPRGKPFPDVFLEAARHMGCAPEECVVLEDSINGVQAATQGLIRCIAFETTTSAAELYKAGAVAVLKNYTFITDDLLYGNS
ncbi:HAD family phosphatase [Candidatus Gracilibacteria bacterium]|nr:HAD family phosphatase [Candidatus Gracilibacteria bacterium]